MLIRQQTDTNILTGRLVSLNWERPRYRGYRGLHGAINGHRQLNVGTETHHLEDAETVLIRNLSGRGRQDNRPSDYKERTSVPKEGQRGLKRGAIRL